MLAGSSGRLGSIRGRSNAVGFVCSEGHVVYTTSVFSTRSRRCCCCTCKSVYRPRAFGEKNRDTRLRKESVRPVTDRPNKTLSYNRIYSRAFCGFVDNTPIQKPQPTHCPSGTRLRDLRSKTHAGHQLFPPNGYRLTGSRRRFVRLYAFVGDLRRRYRQVPGPARGCRKVRFF